MSFGFKSLSFTDPHHNGLQSYRLYSRLYLPICSYSGRARVQLAFCLSVYGLGLGAQGAMGAQLFVRFRMLSLVRWP